MPDTSHNPGFIAHRYGSRGPYWYVQVRDYDMTFPKEQAELPPGVVAILWPAPPDEQLARMKDALNAGYVMPEVTRNVSVAER